MDKNFSLLDLCIIFLRQKRRIFSHFLAVSVLAVAVSYLIPKKYKATTLFLPPYSEGSRFSGLSLSAGLNIGGESAFTSQQIESILDSRKILEETIDKFDLIRVYKTSKTPNKMERALKKLRGNIDLSVSSEMALTQKTVAHFSLSVVDKDKNRAADIANFLVDALNVAMNELTKNQYDYSMNFIKGRLDSVETQKAIVQKQLVQFQKTNKIYSPELKEQVLASVSTYAELKKQKIMAEIEKSLLLFDKEKNNPEVLYTDKKIQELSRKMKQIENAGKPDVIPGLDFSVNVAYTYLNMVQEMEVLVKLELLLRQQYEEARIKNARQAPEVRVIDKAVPPEWKNSPKKVFVVLSIVGVYMSVLLISILARHGVTHSSQETKEKLRAFKDALKL